MTLQTYNSFAPTCFDNPRAFLPDRQNWLLAPSSQTRDSGALDRSNFNTMEKLLKDVDPNSQDHENHRFGHWGPGWFELLIIRPGSTCQQVAENAATALAEYPVLDEEDFSNREFEEACEA